MTWLRRIAALLLTLSLLAGGAFAIWLYRSLPLTEGSVPAAVTQPVKMHFDERGRPFVRAQRWSDAFFAEGFLHARDRLWQMELLRRAGHGRLAELFGAGLLDTDIELITVGVPELAERLEANASARLEAQVAAYTAGVNGFLALEHPRPLELTLLGASVAPWKAGDVFAIAALSAWQSGNNYRNELVRQALIEKLGPERAAIFFPAGTTVPNPHQLDLSEALRQSETGVARLQTGLAAPTAGSNAWAVASSASASGHALFAFDSHDAFSMPNLTYDVHLFVRDEQIRGSSVPGLLGVINGWNEFMAWGFTNIGDSQDLFIETVRGDQFKDGSQWYAPKRRIERIPVRNQPAHELEIVETRNGRLVSTEPPLALRWSPLHEDARTLSLDALLDLNRATSYAAFESAMNRFAAPSANVTYADVTGRVAQRTLGLLPKRAQGLGLAPLPGGAEARWTGTLPMSELPVSRGDRLAAANRPLASQPLVSADNAPGYRIARIQHLLEGRSTLDVAAMQQLQTDTVNEQARRLVPIMTAALDELDLDEQHQRVLDHFLQWAQTGAEDPDTAGPLIFASWYQHYLENQFAEALGPTLYRSLLDRRYLINEAVDNQLLTGAQTLWDTQTALRESFRTTVEQLVEDYGAQLERWHWGNAHRLVMKHELSGAVPGAAWLFDRGGQPLAGGNATVRRARYSYRRPFDATGGATTRMVLELSTPPRAFTIQPGGQSGHPLSQHYADQTQAWIDGRYDELAATPEALGAAALILTPEP